MLDWNKYSIISMGIPREKILKYLLLTELTVLIFFPQRRNYLINNPRKQTLEGTNVHILTFITAVILYIVNLPMWSPVLSSHLY